MGLMRWVIGACFVVLCVVFAISNRNLIALQFWPFPHSFSIQTGLAILLPAFVAFLLGGVWVSLGKTKLWSRARQAEKRAERLENALAAAEQRLAESDVRQVTVVDTPPAMSDPASAAQASTQLQTR